MFGVVPLGNGEIEKLLRLALQMEQGIGEETIFFKLLTNELTKHYYKRI